MQASLENWKPEGNEKWGPLGNLPRADAIFKACTILDASEEGISRDGVRDLIGGGSDRDIAPVIRLFQERQSINSKYAFTPGILLELIAKQVDEIFETLHSDTESKMKDERNAYGKAIEAISIQLVELEETNGRLSKENISKNLEIESLKDNITDFEDRNNRLGQQYQELDNKFKNKLSDIEMLKEKIQDKDRAYDAQETKHLSEITRLGADAKIQRHELMAEQDKERDRLMLVQGNERSTWQSAERKLNKEIMNLNKELNDARNEAISKSELYITVQNRCVEKDTVIEKLNYKLNEMDDLSVKVEELMKCNNEHAIENRLLSSKMSEMTNVNEQIQSLKDEISKIDRQKPSKNKQQGKI